MLRNILIIGIVSLSLAAATVSSNDIDLEKFKSQIPDGIIPPGFNASSLTTTADDAKKLFKEKCQKVSDGEEAFLKAENATEVLRNCLMNLIDIEVLQKEIDEAQPNGDLDTVFNKYCRKRTTAIDCMQDFAVAIEPCLTEEEVTGKTTFVKIFTNLLNFVCHKDGDQIALFIAEKGPECFASKNEALQNCINTTMSRYIPTETPTVENLPQFVMGVQQCNDMNSLQHCVVKELETCEESTPANLVESMFTIRFSTKLFLMPNFSTLKATTGNAPITQKTSWTIVSTALLALGAWTIL